MATAFAAGYRGKFAFMVDMRKRIRKGKPLSDRMITGILNTMRAWGAHQDKED